MSAKTEYNDEIESKFFENYPKEIQKLEEDLDKIINRELKLWQEAFPQQKELLKNFSNKIKLELELRLNI